jgi:hypothetical protein
MRPLLGFVARNVLQGLGIGVGLCIALPLAEVVRSALL